MRRNAQSGFTLIECLVALVLFSSAMAIMYQTMGGNWRSLARVQKDATALSIGKAQLASSGLLAPLADGQQFSGEQDGIAWTVTVERYVAPGEAALDGSAAAYWLRYRASWSDGGSRRPRVLELRALKLEPPA